MIYDERLKNRSENDRHVFMDTMSGAVNVINSDEIDKRIHRSALICATDQILKQFGIKSDQVPDRIKTLDDILDYRMRRKGIFYRKVTLSGNWKKDATFVMMGFLKESHDPVVFIPKLAGGHRFFEYKKGRMVCTGVRNYDLMGEAYVFFRPFPQKAVGVRDVIKLIAAQTPLADFLLYFFAAMNIPHVWYVYAMQWQKLITWQSNTDQRFFVIINVILFTLTIVAFLNVLYSSLMKSKMVERASYALRAAFMARVLTLPHAFFKENDAGTVSSWIFETDTFCRYIFSGGFVALVNLVVAFHYVGFASAFGRSMLPYLIILYLLHVLFFVVNLILRWHRYWPLAQSSTEEYSFSHELFRGINKIKLCGAYKRMYSKWGAIFLKKTSLKYDLPFFLRLGSLPSMALSIIFLFFYYIKMDESGVSYANFIAFNMLYGMFSAVFMTLPKAASELAGAAAILRLIKPVLDSPVELQDGAGSMREITGRISLKRVSYRYEKRQRLVVDDMSLDIRPGEYVALTGRSGCGKSTVLGMILGYLRPDSGGVYFDGIDAQNLDMHYVRRQVGCVLQDSILFDGDIFSNIAVCAPDLTMDEAWEVAEITGIADDIRQMPMGMHTLITGGGDCISGGQRQRLMIARAIASKPKILFFDEATSSLDNLTQKKVSDALDALKCTRIVIAHRLSTIKNCDRIIVMDAGTVAEEGTFEELMNKKGLFTKLVRSQWM